MSVYIKGMEMPQNCASCGFVRQTEFLEDYCCLANDDGYITNIFWRLDDCPLVPVPDHGRLIDADAMCNGLALYNPVVIYAECMPTIIPADKEGGDENA